MPETDVTLRVNETGADRAAAAMDNVAQKTTTLTQLAPNIARLSGGLTGLGQVTRLLGSDFDALGQSISQVGLAATGLGALGAIFGPIGQAIGTVAGIAVGAINLLRGTSEEARQERESLARERERERAKQVTNNVDISFEISGGTSSQIRQEVDSALEDIFRQRELVGGLTPMGETASIVSRGVRFR
jgi:hypothetical protein